MTTQRLPSGRTFDFAPNGLGQATRARYGGDYASGAVYHPNGAPKAFTYGNGYRKDVTLDARQLVSSIKVSKAGSPTRMHLTYGHDANGRITAQSDHVVSGQNRSYGYDGLGRLVAMSEPWGSGSAAYDANGNIRQKYLGARSVHMQYDGRGRLYRHLDSARGAWRYYAYDAKGNVLDNSKVNFRYDMQNQPVLMNGSAGGVFVYDGNLKRARQTIDGETIYTFYDRSGAMLYRDNVTAGVTTDYVKLAGETIARLTNQPGADGYSYTHANHLGSAVAATDPSGALLWRELFTPYGEKRENPAANDN